MTCFCKCPERPRLPWEPCENCGAADAVTCIKVTIDGYYWPIYLSTVVGAATTACGTAYLPRSCFTHDVTVQWKVKSDCSEVDFIITDITASTRVVTRTTQALDWADTGFTVGDYTVELCGGDPTPVAINTIRCIYVIWGISNPLIPQSLNTDEPNDLCGRAGHVCPIPGGVFFGTPSNFSIGWMTWALSQTSAEIILTVPSIPTAIWSVPLASWQALGTFTHPTLPVTVVTSLDDCADCANPDPPCDPSSTDCFPDCISAMTGPDCDTPAHSTLFVELVGPPGRGCCLDNTHTLTYGGGFGAGYSLSRFLTSCNTSGGDPVWFEMELYCSGTDIVLDTTRLDVRGIESSTSDVITMSCVDGNVSYSFTFGARYMCDSATAGEVYTVTIYSNN